MLYVFEENALSFFYSLLFGLTPTYIIADLDLIKEITVKQFGKFVDRLVSGGVSVYLLLCIVVCILYVFEQHKALTYKCQSILFLNKPVFPLQNQNANILSPRVDGKLHSDLFTSRGEEWRKRRHVLSPSFSGHKMKLVSLDYANPQHVGVNTKHEPTLMLHLQMYYILSYIPPLQFSVSILCMCIAM